MAHPHQPRIGDWYQEPEGDPFEVVAVDDDAGTVEVQHFGGEIEEIDLEDWFEMELSPAAPPEDWTGPYDDLERDDLGDIERPLHPENWGGYLDEIDKGG